MIRVELRKKKKTKENNRKVQEGETRKEKQFSIVFYIRSLSHLDLTSIALLYIVLVLIDARNFSLDSLCVRPRSRSRWHDNANAAPCIFRALAIF